MLKNIIHADIKLKKRYYNPKIKSNNIDIKSSSCKSSQIDNHSMSNKSTSTENIIMCDKSTSTEDLVKKEKERKILEKFKKETKKKQKQAELFKQVLGSPRNIEEVEDE